MGLGKDCSHHVESQIKSTAPLVISVHRIKSCVRSTLVDRTFYKWGRFFMSSKNKRPTRLVTTFQKLRLVWTRRKNNWQLQRPPGPPSEGNRSRRGCPTTSGTSEPGRSRWRPKPRTSGRRVALWKKFKQQRIGALKVFLFSRFIKNILKGLWIWVELLTRPGVLIWPIKSRKPLNQMIKRHYYLSQWFIL